MNIRNLHLPLILFTLFFSACKKDNENTNPVFLGQEYFPSETGLTRIYQVDSIYWDEFTGINDTVSYQVKEIIAGTFTDIQGRPTLRIERYLPDTANGNWIIWKVWSANITTTTAEQVEDNIRFLKLIFPPYLNSKWNGNTFNTSGEQEYKITSVNEPDSQMNLSFDSTLTVLQIDDENLISRKYSEERYSTVAGLYYRQNTDYITDITSGIIQSGYSYTEKLLSYSYNP